jgi:hypothetical protein
MIALGGILAIVGSIGSLVCAILVLIQLFKKEGVGLGILGIFCGIYTYIWGWIKSKELGLKNIMLAWTGCIVLVIVGQVLAGAGVATSPEFQDAYQRQMQNQPATNP